MSEVNKTEFLDSYSIIFHDSIQKVSKMNLKPNAYKITLYLFSIITAGNIIINFSQKQIAKDIGLLPSNVSRAFKELFEKQILIKDGETGHVYLNSNLCTIGIPKHFNKKTMDNLKRSQVKNKYFKNQISLHNNDEGNEKTEREKQLEDKVKELEAIISRNNSDDKNIASVDFDELPNEKTKEF